LPAIYNSVVTKGMVIFLTSTKQEAMDVSPAVD
jgi:hypothetical protein